MRALTLVCLVALAGSIVSPAPAQTSPSDGHAVIATTSGPLTCLAQDMAVQCLGVPYASPPIGALRFRPPTPPSRQAMPRDATRFASPCLQSKTDYDPAQGAEDCLYLNVYRPAAAANEHLPVMVWLHGGGFMSGSGNAFRGDALAATAKAIVVTVNYRLGPLGWLALPSLAREADDGSTGNYGLLDSIAALQWVKANAAALGGDPDRITVAGQSAGGEQVLALLSSTRGAGLFQRAISMSAPAALGLPTARAAAARRTAMLQELGCTDDATQAACLRAVPADRLLTAAHENWDLIKARGLQWTPTIDGVILTDQWLAKFQTGDFNRVPVIIGHTKDEATLFQAIFENNAGRSMTESEAKQGLDETFKAVAPLVELEYPAGAFPTVGARSAQILVDAQFAAGEQADRAALARFVPVFAYQSCDPNAPESHVHARFSVIGCGHDSDLAYLFQWDDFAGRRPVFTAEQQTLAEALGSYWGNFARTGDPNGNGLPFWPAQAAGSDVVQLLEPESDGGIRTSPPGSYDTGHHLAFWQRLMWLKQNAQKVGFALTIPVMAGLAFIAYRVRRKRGRAKV